MRSSTRSRIIGYLIVGLAAVLIVGLIVNLRFLAVVDQTNDIYFKLYDATIKTVQVIVLICGAVWAYRRLVIERTHTPHINLSIDCLFFGPIDGHYIANFNICIENKGVVKQELHDLTLRVRGMKENDKFSYHEEYRASFPSEIYCKFRVPRKGDKVIVEPGVTMNMPYITGIPSSYKLILAQTNFRFEKDDPKENRLGAERTFKVEETQR